MRLTPVVLVLLTACDGDGGESKDDDTDVQLGTDVGDTDVRSDSDEGVRPDTDLPDDAYAWPATPGDYPFGPSSVLTNIRVPNTDQRTCCRDWGTRSKNGTAENDNALGALLLTVASFGFDANAYLTEAVEDGAITVLLDHVDYATDDTPFHTAAFFGAREGTTDWEATEAGTGTFSVDPAGFVDGRGEPSLLFHPVYVVDGAYVATGPSLDVVLPYPTFGGTPIRFEEVRINADVQESTDGIGLTLAQISGIMPRDSLEAFLYPALNGIFAESCGCASGVSGDLFTLEAGTWTGDCQSVASIESACNDDDNKATCVALAGAETLSGGQCTTLPALLDATADIDTDGDLSTYEAFSVGLRIEAKPATITGLTPAP